VVSALVLLGVLGVGVSLPKLWRVTPPGFHPQIRVSLLNLVQAWQLRRTAQRCAESGAPEAAASAWQLAVLKNLGDLLTIRQALRPTLGLPEVSPAAFDRIASLPGWLLSLGGTNAQDLALVAQVLHRAGQPEEAYLLLHPRREQLSRNDEVLYLKVLLELEDGPAYAARWERAGAELARDPTLALYHTAYLAGWGPMAVREDARQRLAQALEEGGDRTLITRLQMLDYAQAGDVAAYAEGLERLASSRADRLREHLRYWDLLVQAGRVDQAREVAEQQIIQPRNAGEIIALAEALYRLGLREKGQKLLRFHSQRSPSHLLGTARAIWLERAALLEATADWDGLREMVEELRAMPRAVSEMGGWLDFAEGRADHGLGHVDRAQVAMASAAVKTFPSSEVAFDVGLGLKELGYLEEAQQVLGALEPALRDVPAYWQAVFQIAEGLRQDSVLLLKAAREMRRLRPGDPRWDFSYAAALLLNRLSPAEALGLTRECLERSPDSPEARVNHSLALALNQRWEDAARLLDSIDPLRFDDAGRTIFHACAFEIHLGRGQRERARQDASLVERRHLFPSQVRWCEQALSAAGLADAAGPAGPPP